MIFQYFSFHLLTNFLYWGKILYGKLSNISGEIKTMLNLFAVAPFNFIFWFSGLGFYFCFKYFFRTKNKVAV